MFNKSQIMKEAWVIARRFAYTRESLQVRLSRGLKLAWETAKREAQVAATVANSFGALAAIAADALIHEVVSLRNRTYLKEHGIQRLRSLEGEVARRGLTVAA